MTQLFFRNLILTGLRWSLPGWLVLAYFVLAGSLPALVGLSGAGTIFAATCAIAWRPVNRLLLLQQRLDQLLNPAAEAGPVPENLSTVYALFGNSGALADLAGAVLRLERNWSAERRVLFDDLRSAALLFDALPDPLITLDGNARIVYANSSARVLLTGADDSDPVGRDLSAVLRQPDVLDAVQEILSGRHPEPVEFTRTDQVDQVYEARLEPIASDDAGEDGVRALLVLRDVTSMRRSERMRADFVANVSHELRTPLSSLIGFIETLRGPAREDIEAQERFLELMQSQATRMSRLVADLLSLSRIEMNEHTIPQDTVDLRLLIESVADLLAPRAQHRNVTLTLELETIKTPIPGNLEELTQLFQNLIENAIKYGDEGSCVRIEASPGDTMVTVSIIDQGEGIAREHLPRLTERFYRVDAARSREMGGTGLGLAIVKHIVNRHRGTLNITSETGVGSTFAVTLPGPSSDAPGVPASTGRAP